MGQSCGENGIRGEKAKGGKEQMPIVGERRRRTPRPGKSGRYRCSSEEK